MDRAGQFELVGCLNLKEKIVKCRNMEGGQERRLYCKILAVVASKPKHCQVKLVSPKTCPFYVKLLAPRYIHHSQSIYPIKEGELCSYK